MDYHEKKKEMKIQEKQGAVRGPDGKFLKGNCGGPGFASLSKDKIKYNDILRGCVTNEEFEVVAQKLLERAKAGESWAIRDLMDRLLGKPKNMVDVDLKTTHVDPKTVVNNVAILLGITDEGEDYIEIEQTKPEQIENNSDDNS